MFKTFIEQHLGFTPSLIDPDLYYRRQSRGDGSEYYELLLLYVDDVLAGCKPELDTTPELSAEYVSRFQQLI